jgi:multiple sugar transport system substrate-binding protein
MPDVPLPKPNPPKSATAVAPPPGVGAGASPAKVSPPPGIPGAAPKGAPPPISAVPPAVSGGAPSRLTSPPLPTRPGAPPAARPPGVPMAGSKPPGVPQAGGIPGVPSIPAAPGKALPPAPPLPTAPPPAGAGGVKVGASPAPAGGKVPTINSGGKQPVFAKIRQSPFKFLPIIIGALLLVGGLIFAATKFLGGGSSSSSSVSTPSTATKPVTNTPATSKKKTLTYWGLWETSAAFEEVLSDFEEANPGIEVNYVKQRHTEYRERLQTAIASKNGPDLFRYHAAWTPMLQNELAPMPSSVMSLSEYRETFYPVATEQLQSNGQVVGIPLMYDGLGLYYNKDVFKTAGLEPAKTWAQLKTQATQLTIRSSTGIERGGLAIGNASNVEHFSDILGLLMLQNGADPAIPTSKEAQEALQFYTNFFKADKVWSEDLPTSTVAFARGEVAMMFAPSWRAHEVMAVNPDLNFGIVEVPTLGAGRIGWASFWAEGVSSKTTQKDDAWKLLKFLSSKSVQQKLYNAQGQERTFGEPYSRVDLADDLATEEYVAPFLQDAPIAQGWYMSSYTHDNGLNDQIIKYYADAVNAVLEGKKPATAMETVSQGTRQVLRQYNAN